MIARRITRRIALAAIAPLAAAMGPSRAFAAPAIQLKLGTTGLTVSDWPIMIALGKHLFEQHGIEMESVTAQNASNNVEALLTGGVQFVSSSPDSVILPDQHGANLIAVAGESALVVFRIIGVKGITKLTDLRGANIAVSRPNGPDAAIFDDLFHQAGFERSDYRFVTAGGSVNRLSALVAGGASATMLAPPDDLRALKQGLVDLGFNVGRTKPLQFTTIFVSRDWAQANSAAVINTLRGLRDAIRWLNAPSSKAEAAQILVQFTHVDLDLALQSYDTYVTRFKVFAGEGKINQAGFRNVVDYLTAAGLVSAPVPPVSRFIDERYLEAAAKPG